MSERLRFVARKTDSSSRSRVRSRRARRLADLLHVRQARHGRDALPRTRRRRGLRLRGHVVAKDKEPMTYITAFQSTRQYVLEQHGDAGWQRLRDALRERHDVQLPPQFEASSWLPTQHFVTALNVARDLFG